MKSSKPLSLANRPSFGSPTTKPLHLQPGLAANLPTSIVSPAGSKLLSVSVEDIVYAGSYRSLDDEHVADLQKSIGRIGLTTPISVAVGTTKLILIAGQHRLEAVRGLGWTNIDVIAFDANDANNRLVAISENLHRLELSPLDRADLQVEWLQIFRDQAGQLAQPVCGDQPHDRGISKASRQTGVSPKQFRRAEAIARISPEAKAKARELGLDQNQSALLEIAEGKTAEEQLHIAMEISRRKKQKPQPSEKDPADPVPRASEGSLPKVNWAAAPSCAPPSDGESIPGFLNRRDPEKAFQAVVAAWESSPQFKLAWTDAPLAARSRFAIEVLTIVPSEHSEACHVQ